MEWPSIQLTTNRTDYHKWKKDKFEFYIDENSVCSSEHEFQHSDYFSAQTAFNPSNSGIGGRIKIIPTRVDDVN